MSNNNKQNKRQSRKYFLSFGAVVIDIKTQLEAIGDIEDAEENSKKTNEILEEIYQELLSIFRNSSNILNIEAPKKLNEKCVISYFGFEAKHRVFQLDNPIKLECVLPERMQTIASSLYRDVPPDLIDISPNFTLLYDGISFAYYRPIKKYSGILRGHIDAKKMLKDLLMKKFELAHAAPTPIRQKFIVNLTPNKEINAFMVSKFIYNIVEVNIRKSIKSPDSFMRIIFERTNFELNQFYSLTNYRNMLNIAEWKLSYLCNDILNSRLKLLSIFWNINKKRKIVKELKNQIHDFYELYFIRSRGQTEINKRIPDLMERLKEPLIAISKPLLRDIKVEEIPISDYLNIAELGQKEIESYKSFNSLWITVVTALIAALIGAIIGALLSG